MAKIMLVEDDNNLREIYEARLLAEGHEIISAHDGEEALALAVREKPELIISDVMMPKISGFDMLDILRSSPESKDIKVIMMTALSQLDDKDRADRLGADRYLVKSQVTLEDVIRVAREVLEGAPPAAPEATPEVAPINAMAGSTSPDPAPAATPQVPEPATPAQPAPAAEPTTPAPEPAAQPAPAATSATDDTPAAPEPATITSSESTSETNPAADADPTPVSSDTAASAAPADSQTATQTAPTLEEPASDPADSSAETAAPAATEAAPATAIDSTEETKATSEAAEQVQEAQTTSTELKVVEEQIKEFVEAPHPAEINISEDGQITTVDEGQPTQESSESSTENDAPETTDSVKTVEMEVKPAPEPQQEPINTSLATEALAEAANTPAPEPNTVVAPTSQPDQSTESAGEASTPDTAETLPAEQTPEDNGAAAASNQNATQQPEPSGADPNSPSAVKKVISPINDLTAKPDLDALLAKEEAKEAIANSTPGDTDSAATGQPVVPTPPESGNSKDPGNIAL